MIPTRRPVRHRTRSVAVHGGRRIRRRSAGPSSGSVPRVEWMEDRTLLSTFLVSNANDSGPGSLRQAILESNAAIGASTTIDFDIAGSGVRTISPQSLPARDQPPGPDRRRLPAGLRRDAADPARRQPGRRGRRPADRRTGRHRPRPGHRRLRGGRRHPPRRSFGHRRPYRRRLCRDRPDRDDARARRGGRRARWRGERKPHRQRRRRREGRGRAGPHQRQHVRQRVDRRPGDGWQRRRGRLHRDQRHRKVIHQLQGLQELLQPRRE